MKKLLLKVARTILLPTLGLFFERRHLKGRFFLTSLGGYAWAARAIWSRNILRLGRTYPWPVTLGCSISDPANLAFHPDDINNFQSPGTYFQNKHGRITLGKGCYIAPNVGIITSNHDPLNLSQHVDAADVEIGPGCWLGMNSVILPGVKLGPRTVVGAGGIVSRSFPEGNVVIGGIPAKILKRLDI
jgi:hypothetical protein